MIDRVDKKYCTGCEACVNICPKNCINMRSDIEGFNYPIVDKSKCIYCNKCINSCPILCKNKIKNDASAYACFNKEDAIRKESTSGGIFTLISSHIIKNNGIVFGARFNNSFNVEHSYVEKIEELKLFRGSKYVQSKIGNSFIDIKSFLEKGKNVLFSGTPCQVAGLKTFLKKDYENLICIDIVCHGVPSPLVWNKYKNEISKGKTISNISFRDKTYGWRDYCFKMDFEDGTNYLQRRVENRYIIGFIEDIYLRKSCYNCKFKSLHRQSDLTLADFWGIENINRNMDDENGVSLVIVNSQKGKKILDIIEDNIEIKKVELNEAISYNTSAIKSANYTPRRDYFFNKIDRFKFDKLVDKTIKGSLFLRVRVKVKNIVKYIRRKFI